MEEKQIKKTKRKELLHIKHIWLFICLIFVQLLYNCFAHLYFVMFTQDIILMVLTNMYILVLVLVMTKFGDNSLSLW